MHLPVAVTRRVAVHFDNSTVDVDVPVIADSGLGIKSRFFAAVVSKTAFRNFDEELCIVRFRMTSIIIAGACPYDIRLRHTFDRIKMYRNVSDFEYEP